MRDYRERKRLAHEDYDAAKPTIGRLKTECGERIRELEAEVARLKSELATRSERPWSTAIINGVVRAPEFRPVPKPSAKSHR